MTSDKPYRDRGVWGGMKKDGIVEEGEDTDNASSDNGDSILWLEHMGMWTNTLYNS